MEIDRWLRALLPQHPEVSISKKLSDLVISF
jgi:hypothetical protein